MVPVLATCRPVLYCIVLYCTVLLSDDGPRASDMSPGHRAPAQLLNVGRGRATGPTLHILHILLTVHPQPQPMCLQVLGPGLPGGK